MKTKREKANDLLEKLRDLNVSDSMILDFILNDYMSGDEAYNVLEDASHELFSDDIEEEEEQYIPLKERD
jgi:hypothetical protein